MPSLYACSVVAITARCWTLPRVSDRQLTGRRSKQGRLGCKTDAIRRAEGQHMYNFHRLVQYMLLLETCGQLWTNCNQHRWVRPAATICSRFARAMAALRPSSPCSAVCRPSGMRG